MTTQTVRNPWVRASILGTGVAFALCLLIIAMDIPLLWTLLLLAPAAVVGFLMLRKLDTIAGDPPWSISLFIITVAVLIGVPLFPWEGTAIFGLIAIAVVFGAAVSYLMYRAWLKKAPQHGDTAGQDPAGPTATPRASSS